MNHSSGNVIAVFGPTGVGKTKLGVSLSKYLGGEVVSVDSLQCYKAGAIMTAQPQPVEMGEIPHHLIAYLEANEEPHCDYVAEAVRKIHDVTRRGRLPILIGGSISLGAPLLSEIRDQNFRVFVITLIPDFSDGQYSHAIGVRIDQMVEMGLLEEVHELRMLKPKSSEHNNSKGVWKAVGYPELEPYDMCPADDPYRSLQLHSGLSLMKANTLRYALSQLQWLKRDLIPMAQMYGMECLSLSVKVGGQTWDAEVEKPAVCASSKFCSNDAAISFKDLSGQRVVCLLAGSSAGVSDVHVNAGKELAREMHRHDMQLVYGGGTTGIMGAVASELVKLSGPNAVHGIIPFALARYEETNDGGYADAVRSGRFGKRTIVEDMHTRKDLMFQTVLNGARGSGFVAMSGGYGTMEELLEVTTWRQLRIHDRPVCVFNINGFYDNLMACFQQISEDGFVSSADAGIVKQAKTAGEVTQCLSPGIAEKELNGWKWC